MERFTKSALEAFRTFGAASIAVSEVKLLARDQLVHQDRPTGQLADLLLELEAAHSRLRALFADGHDAAVTALAPQVLVIADRTASALEIDRERPSV